MPDASPSPLVLAVALTKGGTGKTTTAANLAAELAELGARVLLVDADPQGQTAGTLGADPADVRRSGGLGSVLSADDADREEAARSALLSDVRPGLDVCPAGPALATEAARLGADPAAGLLAIGDALDALASSSGSAPAFVLVDCPPGWGPLALGVLAASDRVLCPVALHPLALDAVGVFVGHLDGVQRTRQRFGGERLPLLSRVLPTMYDRRAAAPGLVLDALTSAAADMDRGDGRPPAVASPVPYSVKVQEAAALGRTVREHAGPSHPAAAAYAELAANIHREL